MYEISAYWEVGRRGRPAHAFYVGDKRVGTKIADVIAAVQGPSRAGIAAACREAKDTGRTVVLKPALIGWTASLI